jgi:hypothetical protein
MRADDLLGQQQAIRHDPAGDALRGQVSHRPFGISQAQPATGEKAAGIRTLQEAVADLPGDTLGEREQHRAEVLGGAGQIDHADHLSRPVADGGRGACQDGQLRYRLAGTRWVRLAGIRMAAGFDAARRVPALLGAGGRQHGRAGPARPGQ